MFSYKIFRKLLFTNLHWPQFYLIKIVIAIRLYMDLSCILEHTRVAIGYVLHHISPQDSKVQNVQENSEKNMSSECIVIFNLVFVFLYMIANRERSIQHQGDAEKALQLCPTSKFGKETRGSSRLQQHLHNIQVGFVWSSILSL